MFTQIWKAFNINGLSSIHHIFSLHYAISVLFTKNILKIQHHLLVLYLLSLCIHETRCFIVAIYTNVTSPKFARYISPLLLCIIDLGKTLLNCKSRSFVYRM